MPLKRLAVCATALLLGLGLATSAQADKIFSLTGGGGQLHIGNGLQLPIQAAATAGMMGTVYPPLLVPVNGVPKVLGTVTKPLLTAMATTMGPITKQGYQRRLSIPKGVLSKPGILKTVGLKFSNPSLFAVATNLQYTWPAAPAVLSTGAATGVATVSNGEGTLTYSNTLGSRFGGPAQFRLASGGAAGVIPAPVTLYLKINATTPPCTHPAFAGGAAGCIAGLMQAVPTGLAPIGGMTATTGMTPGGPVPGMNIAAMKMGAVPLGTVLAKVLVATAALPTNMATSQPGPWTTGMLIVSNPKAGGMGEKFTISGRDQRTAGGGGTISLVAGSLSKRVASGPNANRGWLRLVLTANTAVPSMSLTGLAVTVALILLGFGYATRRRFA